MESVNNNAADKMNVYTKLFTGSYRLLIYGASLNDNLSIQ